MKLSAACLRNRLYCYSKKVRDSFRRKFFSLRNAVAHMLEEQNAPNPLRKFSKFISSIKSHLFSEHFFKVKCNFRKKLQFFWLQKPNWILKNNNNFFCFENVSAISKINSSAKAQFKKVGQMLLLLDPEKVLQQEILYLKWISQHCRLWTYDLCSTG